MLLRCGFHKTRIYIYISTILSLAIAILEVYTIEERPAAKLNKRQERELHMFPLICNETFIFMFHTGNSSSLRHASHIEKIGLYSDIRITLRFILKEKVFLCTKFYKSVLTFNGNKRRGTNSSGDFEEIGCRPPNYQILLAPNLVI